MMNTDLCYSLNGEEFYKDIDLIDFSDFEVGEEVTLDVAEIHPYYPHDQAFANVVVELMTSNTFNDLGEETAVDWCNDVDSLDTEHLQEEIQGVVRRWLTEHKCATVLWRVGREVDSVTVIVTEDGFEVEDK